MSEEIKEILDRLDFNEWEVDLYKVPITWNELYTIRNYITNLQKENKELKKNQRYYKNGVFSLEYDKETMSDMIDDFKSRCEKASNLIEPLVEWGECTINGKMLKSVYDILNGRSDK